MSALKRNKQNAISGKQKDSVQKEMLAASAMMRRSVDKQHSRPLAPKPQTRNDGRRPSKGKSLRGRSPSGKGYPEDRAKTASVEIVRIRHVILGILPNVNITKHNRNANSVKSENLGTERLSSVSETNDRKEWW